MSTIVQAIVELLKAYDVRFVFGKVGDYVLPLFDRLANESSIRLISTYREETAVLMADGYARTSGKPGVVVLSAENSYARTVAAVAQAHEDGSPVIVVVVEQPSTFPINNVSPVKGPQQKDYFENIIRSTYRVSHPQRAIRTLAHACRLAVSGKKGPVYCGIPSDFLDKVTLDDIGHLTKLAPSGRISADDQLIRKACDLITAAQNPVILLGGGAIWSGATVEAKELAESLFAPIATTNGKSGVVPDDYPLSIGRLGSKANPVALQTVAEADLLLAVGCTFNEHTTLSFSDALFAPDVKIIQVDIDPSEIGKNYPVELGIVGDAKAVLADMLTILRQLGTEKWPTRSIHRMQKLWERKETWSNQWSRLARSNDVPIRRIRLLRDLADEVGREAIILGEVEWKNCLNMSYFPIIEGYDFAIPGGNLGLAMGAKLAMPERPVVAVLGDGEAMNAFTELSTAVEHQIQVLTVIVRNGCYGRAKVTQTQFFEGRYVGVDHPFPNFTDVALSLGAYAERVENPTEIRPAIRRALQAERPSLVEVLVSGAVADLKPAFD